eukprot:CAMPEP_0202035860 /NCGR_PEP_ID=MMETSP0962-20130828/1187_1 /ASSEMBLY_ACC=CAM_ASM_000488 /TAXON_ID=4773 /ORGANISM="Schizochytrium aggregatum, Strain ATCC28209" /LENGTH=65 /DNA_ID=CAMNT_0048599911 /DNA_START=92 /DNA_END=289 /DNA_ORIENTATION=+
MTWTLTTLTAAGIGMLMYGRATGQIKPVTLSNDSLLFPGSKEHRDAPLQAPSAAASLGPPDSAPQ